MYRQITTDHTVQLSLHEVIEVRLPETTAPPVSGFDRFFRVNLFHEDGEKLQGCGYIDGQNNPVFRFSPPKKGRWRWHTASNQRSLSSDEGEFIVLPPKVGNRFQVHGPVVISKNHRHFVHQDGTPFFWLGESAWCAVQQSDEIEWKEYLGKRSTQGYTVVQFNTLLNWEGTVPYRREPFPWVGGKPDLNAYDADYFNYLDFVIDANAEAGMLSAPVVLWFNYIPGSKPGWYEPPYDWVTFSEEQAYLYGKFLGSRYSAYPLVWLLSGDVEFCNPNEITYLSAVAAGIKEASFQTAPMSVHPAASAAYSPQLINQPWLDFFLLQSGHKRDGHGLPSSYVRAARRLKPIRPVVNGEMFFEYLGYTRVDERITREVVRQAAWESFLAGANAGISYGNHGVWCWYHEGITFRMPHLWKEPMPWREGLNLPGAEDVARVKKIIEPLPWQNMEEGFDLPIQETGVPEPIISRLGGDKFILCYLPQAHDIRLTDPTLAGLQAKWFDPASDYYESTEIARFFGGVRIKRPTWEHDAVLLIGPRTR